MLRQKARQNLLYLDCPVRFAPYIPEVKKFELARPKHLLLWKNRTLDLDLGWT